MAIDTQKNNLLSNTKSRAELAELLDITDKSLIYFLYRRPVSERYLSFEIPKKNGGVRVISTPASHLKVAQKKLSDLLYEIYVPYLETHGFVKNKSILSNAKMHVSANKKPKWVLNIDIKDFFSAINFGRVYKLFLSPPYSFNKEISTLLAQICCHENKLPQGAPSSPIISNLICRRLDRQLRKIARDNSCEYSRYADDITFSSKKKYFPKSIAKLIENDESKSVVKLSHELHYAIKSNGFELNFEKLRLAHHSQHLEVTGLTVNEKPNVNREYVRELRSMLHAWEKYGLENAQKVFNEKFSIKSRSPQKSKTSF